MLPFMAAVSSKDNCPVGFLRVWIRSVKHEHSIPTIELLIAKRGVCGLAGFVLDDHSLAKRVAGLTAKLNEAGLPFVGDFFYTAGYDSPFHLTNRTNEIWVRQSGSSQKPSAALQ